MLEYGMRILSLINAENIAVFWFGFCGGFGLGRWLFPRVKIKARVDSIDARGGSCAWSYKLKGECVGLTRFFVCGKKVGLDCQYLQRQRLSKKPFCSLLECRCKEL